MQGVRSFVDRSEIIFPRSGITLLNGKNHDTKGSSGSGKSSVATAIAWALGFCPFAATDMKSWQAKKASVTLVLETDVGEIAITRGKSFELAIGGVPFEGSAAQAEEKLDQILGLSAEMRTLLTYRGQRKPGLFLSMKDLKQKEFLMRLLGLDKFEDALEVGALKVGMLTTKAGFLQSAYETKRAQVDAIKLEDMTPYLAAVTEAQDALGRMRALKLELDTQYKTLKQEADARVSEARSAFDAPIVEAKGILGNFKSFVPPVHDTSAYQAIKTRADDVAARLKRLMTEDDTRKKTVDQQRQLLNREILQQNQAAGALTALDRDKIRIEGALSSLKRSICPTCEREWKEVEAKKTQLETELAAAEAKIAAATTAKGRAAELTAELAAIPAFEANPMVEKLREVGEKLRNQLQVEASKIQSEKDAAKAEFEKLKVEAQMVVTSLQLKQSQEAEGAASAYELNLGLLLDKLQEIDLDSLHIDVKQAENEARRVQGVHDSHAKLTEESAAAKAVWDIGRVELEKEKDFLHLIGREGFLGSIFDEILNEISDETNKILASVANTRHCTLRFTSEATTQKGTVQRKIVPIIKVGEFEAPFDSGLSGGMQSAVELAVDLAVGTVISQRSGASPAWIVLDECFEGLDVVSKEACFEVLQTFAHDRLALIIDHSSEFKSLISHQINIEFKDGKSWVA